MITACLGDTPIGVFLFDSEVKTIRPFVEHAHPVKREDFITISVEVKKFLTEGKEEPHQFEEWTLIPFKRGTNYTGFVMAHQVLSESEIQLVQLLIQIWFQANNQLELKENNEKLAEDLGRNLHNLSVVRSIAQLVSKAQDIEHLLGLILKVAVTTVNASKGLLFLENEESKTLELIRTEGVSDRELSENKKLSISEYIVDGIHEKVIASEEPILLNDVIDPASSLQGWNSLISVMCVPLVMKNNVFGVIYLSTKEQTPPFDHEDLNVLSILSSHASAVLDQARLYTMASTDELTGLYTRRYYIQRIGDEYKRCTRYKRHLSMIVVDIDFFKKVNDTYGHHTGDIVLKEVANLIKQAIRVDIDTAVRFGGEEFVVILPETHLRGAWQVAERIRKWVEEASFECGEDKIKSTVSLGISAYPENGAAIEDLFNMSDSALYRSKKAGRNQITAIPSL